MLLNSLIVLLKEKFDSGLIEDYELVIALLCLVQKNTVKIEDVGDILKIVHQDNLFDVLKSLKKANLIIDDTIINEIIGKCN